MSGANIDGAPSASLSPELLEILVCPLTKASLRYDAAAGELVSDAAGLAYPIRDGVPHMLVEEARRIEEIDALPMSVRAGPDDAPNDAAGETATDETPGDDGPAGGAPGPAN